MGRQQDLEHLKQQFIGSVTRRAARLGLAVQTWDDALASSEETPRDARDWSEAKNGIFINAWNNNRLSNAFSYADAGYKVCVTLHVLVVYAVVVFCLDPETGLQSPPTLLFFFLLFLFRGP